MGREQAAVEVTRKEFRVTIGGDPLRLIVQSADLRQEFVPQIGIDTAEGLDRTITTGEPHRTQYAGYERIGWDARSTGWDKRYHVDVYEGHVVFSVEAHGRGDVDAVRYFDEIAAADFREHFALTKHFNDRGHTPARAYSTGSPIGFTHLLCPEPNSHARQVLRPHEYAQISVNADLDYNGGNFVADPGLLAFALTAAPESQWWAVGLATEPGRHTFSELEYLGGEDFALNLNYWGAVTAAGHFAPPGIVLAPGDSAADALTTYVGVLNQRGATTLIRREEKPWWSRPIACGWGHQAWQGDLFRIRSSPERAKDNAVYTLCTQANYQDITARLEAAEVPFGTLVIDARWFQSGGLKDIDAGRWPDLAGFVAAQHRQGRKVLLWWGPWDSEGVPPEECVLWQPESELRTNRPGRLTKFGIPLPGAKLGVDITLPTVRDRIRHQVRFLLGTSPDCVNADGLKIDHQSAVPGLFGMVFPAGSGQLFGIEAAYEIQKVIYQAAKETKADALVIGQSPNPYFSDVQDMLRLGDIYAHQADSVLPEMQFRADMARIADPSILIDTDGWPMPSLAAWREYVKAQPSLGVPSLYYASHLDTTGEALTETDFALLRGAWR